MSFEFDPTRPIYLQIMEEIKKRAVRGQYAAGQQLPPVREMAQVMGVNPNTMARAYMELEREGFVTTRRGTGSFVTDTSDRVEIERQRFAAAAQSRFVTEIRQLNLDGVQCQILLENIRSELSDD